MYRAAEDDVDEYIRTRQREGGKPDRARRSDRTRADAPRRSRGGNPEERSRARELLVTDFFWSDLATNATKAAAPPPEALTRAWDDAIESTVTGRAAITGSVDGAAVVPAFDVSPRAPLALAGAGPEPARRTVVITGRGAERYVSPRRGYDAQLRRHERAGFKPDRVAMWAVLLGLALLLGAATSSHAAVLHAVALHAAHTLR